MIALEERPAGLSGSPVLVLAGGLQGAGRRDSSALEPVVAPMPTAHQSVWPRVVLADDESVIRAATRAFLEDCGFAVVGEAADGAQALAMIDEQRPDVVLMDVRMPGIDGLDTARTIRARHPDIQVVVLSAYDDPIFRQAARELGPVAYLVKGCSPLVLEQALRDAVEVRRRLCAGP